MPRSPSLVGRRLANLLWQTAVSVYTDREFKSHPRRLSYESKSYLTFLLYGSKNTKKTLVSNGVIVRPQKTDIHEYRRRLELAFEKIEVEQSFTEEDKRLVREFGRHLLSMGQSPGRVCEFC